MTTKYIVSIEGSDLVNVTVNDGPTAYNTARAIAVAVARINPGAVVLLDRGHRTERYVGVERTTVDVRKHAPKRKRK